MLFFVGSLARFLPLSLDPLWAAWVVVLVFFCATTGVLLVPAPALGSSFKEPLAAIFASLPATVVLVLFALLATPVLALPPVALTAFVSLTALFFAFVALAVVFFPFVTLALALPVAAAVTAFF